MNFMGMGIMELAVIFLVSFLVLGPSKSIDMARTAGKVIRDLRSAMSDLTSAVDLDQTSPPSASSQASMTAPTIEIQPGVAVPLEENAPGKPEDAGPAANFGSTPRGAEKATFHLRFGTTGGQCRILCFF